MKRPRRPLLEYKHIDANVAKWNWTLGSNCAGDKKKHKYSGNEPNRDGNAERYRVRWQWYTQLQGRQSSHKASCNSNSIRLCREALHKVADLIAQQHIQMECAKEVYRDLSEMIAQHRAELKRGHGLVGFARVGRSNA